MSADAAVAQRPMCCLMDIQKADQSTGNLPHADLPSAPPSGGVSWSPDLRGDSEHLALWDPAAARQLPAGGHAPQLHKLRLSQRRGGGAGRAGASRARPPDPREEIQHVRRPAAGPLKAQLQWGASGLNRHVFLTLEILGWLVFRADFTLISLFFFCADLNHLCRHRRLNPSAEPRTCLGALREALFHHPEVFLPLIGQMWPAVKQKGARLRQRRCSHGNDGGVSACVLAVKRRYWIRRRAAVMSRAPGPTACIFDACLFYKLDVFISHSDQH